MLSTKYTLAGLVPLMAIRVAAQDAPTLPALDPELGRDVVWDGLNANLFAPGSNSTNWDAGWTFQSCYDQATENGFSPADYEVFDVYYEDCAEPWTMCRNINQVSPTRDEMIDAFGKIPVRARSFVKNVVVQPEIGGAAGLFFNYAVAFAEGYMDEYVVAHETTHALDFGALADYGSPFSETTYWTDAYWQDSNSPTTYAMTNWVENFAESGPLGLFDTVVAEGIESIQPSWDSIDMQYNTLKDYLGDIIIPGGTCGDRIAPDESVEMGGTFQALAATKPKGFRSSSMKAKQVPHAPRIADDHFHLKNGHKH